MDQTVPSDGTNLLDPSAMPAAAPSATASTAEPKRVSLPFTHSHGTGDNSLQGHTSYALGDQSGADPLGTLCQLLQRLSIDQGDLNRLALQTQTGIEHYNPSALVPLRDPHVPTITQPQVMGPILLLWSCQREGEGSNRF